MNDDLFSERLNVTNHPDRTLIKHLKDTKGFLIAIVSDRGFLREVYVPYKSDGIHNITSDDGKTNLLLILKQNGEWTATCGTGVLFADNDLRSVVLMNCLLLKLVYQGICYFIYIEEVNQQSGMRHNYLIEKNRPIVIGRDDDCDIKVNNAYVSRHHATLVLREKGWRITDTHSTNGIFVNSHKVSDTYINYGDIVFIMGLRIVAGYGFVSINDGNNRTKIQSSSIHLLEEEKDVPYSTPLKDITKTDNALFNRLPRKRELIKAEPIVFDNPPPSLNGDRIPFLLRMGNPALMGGRAILTGNYFMAATSLIMPFVTQGYSEKERKEYEEQRIEKYEAYLTAKKQQIEEECQKEKRILEKTYPCTSIVAAWPFNKQRLWERRNVDDDFLSIRIGCGNYPMLAPYDCDNERFSIEEDELEKKMREITASPRQLTNAPVITSLTQDFVNGVIGEQRLIHRFVKNLMIQIIMTHSPDEVKIVLLCDKEDVKEFELFRFQPHMRDDNFSIRFLATDVPEAVQISRYLSEQLEEDIGKQKDLIKMLKDRAYYVIFALNKKLLDAVEILKDVLKQDRSVGVSIVACFPELPKECTKIFHLDWDENRTSFLRQPDHYPELFKLDELPETVTSQSLLKTAGIRVYMPSVSYLLPQTVTFLEMYGVGRVEHLAPLRRWSENNPVKSLSVPVGIGTDGEPFMLDLHQKQQGPHGLVAGTTGSGKSEFLITYILSLAVNFSPDEVTFLLIDYKGGGLAGAFYDHQHGLYLPHIVGTITNLDGAAIQRSLISINAELKHRQRVLNEAKSITNSGTIDIYDYQRLYRAGKLKRPMPHLFIISDEFAELKTQQPEFLTELISTARIGRSLGVHLILATQKPSGIVNDQIVSNTKFRVCLRVADKSDSMEMLKRPEASELRDTGRFYLQVGNNEYFAMGQSAWSGAAYEPSDDPPKTIDDSVSVLDATGQAILSLKPEKKTIKSENKQLVAIVKLLAEIAAKERIVPKSLWKEPLEKKISIEELESKLDKPPAYTVYAGVIDDPEQQTRHILNVDLLRSKNILILGESGSGKTAFLKTILYGVIRHHSPEDMNFYVLDLSGRSLIAFRNAPHCGAALNDENEQDFDRLLSMLRSIVYDRKKLFEEAGVSDYESYLASQDDTCNKIPLILVVIDNISGLAGFAKGSDYYMNINQYFKEGLSYGIRFIVTATHSNELSSKSKQELTTRFALQLKDKYEYSEALNVRCNYTPPALCWRGLCVFNEAPLEFHIAILRPEETEKEGGLLIQSIAQKAAKKFSGKARALELPVIREDQEYEEFCEGIPAGRIPLGYSLQDAKKISIPLKQAGFLSIYFGNTDAKSIILQNFLYGFSRVHGKLIFLTSESGSVTNGDGGIHKRFSGEYEILQCKSGVSTQIVELLISVIEERKTIRNQYCRQHGIDQSLRDSLKKAEDTIRKETDPVFVVIENFLSFSNQMGKQTKETTVMKTIFEIAKYYNIYFLAGYDPNDTEKLIGSPLHTAFNPDRNIILFGGRTDKQNLVSLDYKSVIKETLPKYGRGMMEYRGKLYTISMPCGAQQQSVSEEESSIF